MTRIGESIEGEKIDLDALLSYKKWTASDDKVEIIGENEKVIATVSVNILIDCWIEKEQNAYKTVMEGVKKP